MFYLLFQYNENQRGKFYEEFAYKDDLIKYLVDNSKLILRCRIIESEKEYEFKLVRLKEDEKLECKKCGGEISLGSTTGYCVKCSSGSRLKTAKRTCSTPGCEKKIADWNKSGLCSACHVKRSLSSETAKRREKRAVQKTIEKGEPKKGKCRRCKKEFELEDWQHSSMHWCSECRASPDYKNFSETQTLGKI